MSPEIIGLIAVCIVLILMFVGLPIAISMILVGFFGVIILAGINQAFWLVGATAGSTLANYTFAVLPVFLIMGEFADISGMMSDAYRAANIWLRRLPGGLAMASVVGAAAFSTVSGSSTACTAIMTRVALPQLLKHKYAQTLAAGALAAGGTLGNLIPPGTLLVIYAVMTEVSLGKFFLACYIPGFLLTFMYMIQIYIQCKLNPSLSPSAPAGTSWKEKLFAIKDFSPVLIVLLLTLGGIQFGIFTPNEAASISTVFVFFYALIRKTLNGQKLIQAFKSTLITTGMAFAIVIGANMLNVFLALAQLPQALASFLVSMNLSPLGVIIFIMVIYMILGIPMDALAMVLLTLPIFLPVLNAFGIDLLWFGVLVIIQCELANLTPPVGMNLFVVMAMSKPLGISTSTIFRGALPFCLTCLVCVILLVAFPQLSLFLPSLVK